jgi:hypothetical protein
MLKWIVAAVFILVVSLAGCTTDVPEASFTLTVAVLPGSVTPLAPLAWAVHTGDNPLYTPGTDTRIDGLESLAEDGDPATAGGSLMSVPNVETSGIADTPVGQSSPGPATPGLSYSFSFTAREGDKLSLASMYVQSNDLFYGPGASGIPLFSSGSAISGDITAQITLYDAGTEVNEQPGTGPNQAPRQSAPNTGVDENGTVRLIADVMDGFSYPADSDVIMVSIAVDN